MSTNASNPDDEKWLQDACAFLKDKNAEDIVGYYKLLGEFGIGRKMEDRIATAMRHIFDENATLKQEVVALLLTSSDLKLRGVVYWIIESEVFTDPWAADVAWNQLLGGDPDEFLERMHELLNDRFEAVDDAPLDRFLLAAERLHAAQQRLDQA